MLANFMAAALSGLIALPASPAHPPTSGAGLYMTSVTLGEIDPDGVVPTINGVPNAGTLNWDIALPRAQLTVGMPYKLTFSFEDIGYNGPCSVEVRMTQVQGGKKVRLRGLTGLGTQCTSPNVYMGATDFGKIPDAPGPVTITATVHYGANQSSTKVQMLIQE